MALFRSSALLCLLGVWGLAVLPGCGAGEPSEDARLGTLGLSLTAQSSSGNLYRLRQGHFDIEGASTAELSTETDPDASSLTVELDPGDYLITLADGWLLEKAIDSAFVAIEATLESPNPAAFSIASNAHTAVSFQFRTAGDLICPDGTLDCDGSCVDVSSDPQHCGACGDECSVPGATPACSAGVCAIGSCDPGLADCDASASNGCETAPASDVNHCGGCGMVCVTPDAAAGCQEGACTISACDAGFADCDGDVSSGCEVMLDADPACAAPDVLTPMPGDAVATQSVSGVGEKRYRLRINESRTTGPATDLRVRFRLSNPPDVHYRLEASCDDGCTLEPEEGPSNVRLRWREATPLANDSGRDVFVSVVYASSVVTTPGCASWSLEIDTGFNGGPVTCSAK